MRHLLKLVLFVASPEILVVAVAAEVAGMGAALAAAVVVVAAEVAGIGAALAAAVVLVAAEVAALAAAVVPVDPGGVDLEQGHQAPEGAAPEEGLAVRVEVGQGQALSGAAEEAGPLWEVSAAVGGSLVSAGQDSVGDLDGAQGCAAALRSGELQPADLPLEAAWVPFAAGQRQLLLVVQERAAGEAPSAATGGARGARMGVIGSLARAIGSPRTPRGAPGLSAHPDRPHSLPAGGNRRDIPTSLNRGGGSRKRGGSPKGIKDSVLSSSVRERPTRLGPRKNIGIPRDPLANRRREVRHFPRRPPVIPDKFRTPVKGRRPERPDAPAAPVFNGPPQFISGPAIRQPVPTPVRAPPVGGDVDPEKDGSFLNGDDDDSRRTGIGRGPRNGLGFFGFFGGRYGRYGYGGGWWYPYMPYYWYPRYRLGGYHHNQCVAGGMSCHYNSDCCSNVCAEETFTCGAAFLDYNGTDAYFDEHDPSAYRRLQASKLPPPPPVSRLPPAFDENTTLAFLPPDEAPYVPEAYTGSPLPPVGLGVNTTAGRAALVSLPEYEALEGQLFETNGTFVYKIGNVTYFFVPDNETDTTPTFAVEHEKRRRLDGRNADDDDQADTSCDISVGGCHPASPPPSFLSRTAKPRLQVEVIPVEGRMWAGWSIVTKTGSRSPSTDHIEHFRLYCGPERDVKRSKRNLMAVVPNRQTGRARRAGGRPGWWETDIHVDKDVHADIKYCVVTPVRRGRGGRLKALPQSATKKAVWDHTPLYSPN
ncbi:unnamed protein product [Vitrella brassicaformis CCMP3155]|uniref:Uncharacterized protein n=1 Tax=Vitrella brassicaformis (strain CCMP3155) TaxID=1169540 RepID=A0A0G4F3H3_VITBC|nr:unnamed protein product [Vitrella brassicaformis CCMP3155]|eukprot:CEM06377.1 unnamed protein product [Vitrella brassicaformis CCMP3155]